MPISCDEWAPAPYPPRFRPLVVTVTSLGAVLCLWSWSALLHRNDGLTWALGPPLLRMGTLWVMVTAQTVILYPLVGLPLRRRPVDVLTGAWVGWVIHQSHGPGWALLSIAVAGVLLGLIHRQMGRDDPECRTAPWWELVLLPTLGQVVGYAAAILASTWGG